MGRSIAFSSLGGRPCFSSIFSFLTDLVKLYISCQNVFEMADYARSRAACTGVCSSLFQYGRGERGSRDQRGGKQRGESVEGEGRQSPDCRGGGASQGVRG